MYYSIPSFYYVDFILFWTIFWIFSLRTVIIIIVVSIPLLFILLFSFWSLLIRYSVARNCCNQTVKDVEWSTDLKSFVMMQIHLLFVFTWILSLKLSYIYYLVHSLFLFDYHCLFPSLYFTNLSFVELYLWCLMFSNTTDTVITCTILGFRLVILFVLNRV